MECAQVNITGGTGARTPASVSLPGAYQVCFTLLLLNIYDQTREHSYEEKVKEVVARESNGERV